MKPGTSTNVSKNKDNSDDEQAAIVNIAMEDIGTSEMVFLSLHALIHSLSMFSEQSTQTLRYSKKCSLTETIITLYQNERIFSILPF